MKNKSVKRYLLIISALVLMLSMTACAVDPSYDGSDTDTITVEMNIDFPDSEFMNDNDEFANDDNGDDKNIVDDNDIVEENKEVDYPEDVERYKMQVENGATVMQILESFASQNNLEIQVETADGSVYVTSIGGAAAGAASGWIYEINGKSIMEAACNYIPKNGDEIAWKYIKF